MENGWGQEVALNTPTEMAARVFSDAKRAFGDRADDSWLERCANDAVADLWRDSINVTTFVPVLAMRLVREMLEDDARDIERATQLA